jgi:methionyl-tRNA synthetase
MSPFLPFSAVKVRDMLNLPGNPDDMTWNDISGKMLPTGHVLGKPEIIFTKIEDSVIQIQIDHLQAMIQSAPAAQVSQSPVQPEFATIEDFTKLDLRTAEVVKAERVEKSKKLLKLQVRLGDEERQVIAGIAEHYSPEELIGQTVIMIANLKPAKIFGMESRGMVLAVEHEKQLSVLTPHKTIPAGSRVK